MNSKEYISGRAAKELRGGEIVNLGIGIPTMVPDYLSDNVKIYIHSENGILGVGPSPSSELVDFDLVNAGKKPITLTEGASFFDSAMSFSMIRGGHIDVAILGVLQVDEKGRVANWHIPSGKVLGIGGAMDLLEGAKKVIVTTTHTTKDGKPKLVKEATFPLTSNRKVDLIITDLAVFEVNEKGLLLKEIATGKTLEEVKHKTEASFKINV
ncbi:3-oxoacid CoA-transferase subunit B [Virgibacillus dakarensis]|nr:3-oxoacid CoA-transferase subunit B [Virgibacillus dakarensis]